MHHKTQHHHPEFLRGFTLIELMVTIAILAILMGLAIPSFQQMIQANRLQSASAEFQSALALARAEAIKRGGDSRVTVLANTVDGTISWNNGYTVFVDRSASTTVAQLTTESLSAAETARSEQLLTVPALNAAITMTDTLNYVTFNGMGRTIVMGQGNGFLASTYQLSPASGATSASTRCIFINSMGRMRSEKVEADCPANT